MTAKFFQGPPLNAKIKIVLEVTDISRSINTQNESKYNLLIKVFMPLDIFVSQIFAHIQAANLIQIYQNPVKVTSKTIYIVFLKCQYKIHFNTHLGRGTLSNLPDSDGAVQSVLTVQLEYKHVGFLRKYEFLIISEIKPVGSTIDFFSMVSGWQCFLSHWKKYEIVITLESLFVITSALNIYSR